MSTAFCFADRSVVPTGLGGGCATYPALKRWASERTTQRVSRISASRKLWLSSDPPLGRKGNTAFIRVCRYFFSAGFSSFKVGSVLGGFAASPLV
jgi:hypothetical protein